MLGSLGTTVRRFMSRGKLVTRQDAIEIAEACLQHPCVTGVELFGSLARKGVGGDIDLILIVSEDLAQRFLWRVRLQSSFTGAYAYGRRRRGPAAIRKALAISVLYEETPDTYDLASLSFGRLAGKIDVFLFPEDWRERAMEIQRSIPLWDPDFMSNIARDTRKFDPKKRAFV